MRNIIVVGAGTAGWITALYIRKILPNDNVTVIGSEELGILGAGEGTTPKFIDFLKFVNIPLEEIFQYCKSTFKLGIKFSNWNNDGNHYIHSFTQQNLNIIKKHIGLAKVYQHLNKDYFNYVIEDELCENFYTPFSKSENSPTINYAMHIDANLLASYLKKISESRQIKYKNSLITDFICDDSGNIKVIKTDDGDVNCDFIFDCSGFKRLIVGNKFKSEWIDCSDKLIVNKAIPFFTKADDKLETFTTSRAMKYGWCWKIPLQHRNGCGYVFNSDLCDDDTIKKEIYDNFPGAEIGDRSFNFKTGYYKDIWINNCIAIGLSSGFVEPLEATSILTSFFMLETFQTFANDYINVSQKVKDDYNECFNQYMRNIVDFLHFHYMTKRRDTEFWRIINECEISNSNLSRFERWKYNLPSNFDSDKFASFNLINQIIVGFGINFFDKDMIVKYLYNNERDILHFKKCSDSYKKTIRETVSNFISQDDFIKNLPINRKSV